MNKLPKKVLLLLITIIFILGFLFAGLINNTKSLQGKIKFRDSQPTAGLVKSEYCGVGLQPESEIARILFNDQSVIKWLKRGVSGSLEQ